MTFSANKNRVNKTFRSVLNDNLSTITGGCVTLYPVSYQFWNTFFNDNGVSIRNTPFHSPNTIATARRTMTLASSGTYTITAACDDNMTLRVGPYTFSGLSYYTHGCGGCSPYQINVNLEAGIHLIEAAVDNSGGGTQGFAVRIIDTATSTEVFNFKNKLTCPSPP